MFSLIKHLPDSSFISNKLSNGYIVHSLHNANAEVFFNRKRELVNFKEAFSDFSPKLHVVLGPPSTGKTTLVHQILTNDKNFNPIFINCRSGQFDSLENVYNSLSRQFKTFFDKQKEYLRNLPNFEMGFKANIPDFELSSTKKEKEEITFAKVSELFNKIANALPDWNFWNSYKLPQPILVIDEANRFSRLGNSLNGGQELLKSFLDWLVLNTKEQKSFHAILTSSDSFFLDWIINELHIPHVTPYIVGDLSKKEAEEYFEKHVLPRYECKELEGKFDQVCKITGTRMLIIDMYVGEYEISKGKLADRDFSVYELEYDKLYRGLNPNELHPYKSRPPLWKDDDLIKTMEAIVNAKDQGYILERELVKEIGFKQVNSLINYNFLHRRPTKRFAYDIKCLSNEAILTAMNMPSVRAMEDHLSLVSSNKK
ncbi:hypothetical protein RhiirA4_514484 [Rhizophagus irregularis]|uniref:ATPase domain-containing protein n=1 Tax=Rhizophagus irregularis TaxID=588596 RepID=A0A2I1FW74_9GLOM|nr:hypothetical protein RhiirA4_514484 [Rhizophagus irregularis]